MSRPFATALALTLAAGACDSRGGPPGKPAADSQEVRPSQVMDFAVLYGSNCAGCHGPQGRGGPAAALGDPVYLALADDAFLRRVSAEGVPGTAMPAFARSAGGMLTDAQIDAIVKGMRARWAKPDVLRGVAAPPLIARGSADAKRGESAFAVFCASCHGAGGRGGPRASSIVDGSYLALVSDQALRTTVIVGRPELGAPDWRGNAPGKPMSPEDVSDVVAWLAAHRVEFPGQPYPGAPAVVRGQP
jgi:mono/diheme cytochrome c family protein